LNGHEESLEGIQIPSTFAIDPSKKKKKNLKKKTKPKNKKKNKNKNKKLYP
jgi:hypothetical protein